MLPDVEMFDQQPQQPTAEHAVKGEATQDVIVSDGTKTQKSIWLGRKTKTAETKKPAIKRLSKKIEKPPRKVPIKKLQVEEKKKARKQKAEEAKELKKMHQSTAGQAEIASTDIQSQSLVTAANEVQADAQQKYYMNFDFYFKRTSFRTMTLYFKTAFKPFFEKWKG